MAVRTGLGAQLGLAEESTYGTYVAPTVTLEFNSEGLDAVNERIESSGIRRGSTVRRAGRWANNKKGGGGPLSFELASKGFGVLFEHALGARAITTPSGSTNARQHQCTLGDMDDLSLTIQKGVPEASTGTVKPYNFLGCVVTEWELSIDVDGLLMANYTMDAREVQTTSALASPAYPTNDALFSYQQTQITLDGGNVCATAATLSVAHGMNTGRYCVRSSDLGKKRPLVADMRSLGGTISLEFDDDTHADAFLAMAPGSEIEMTWSVQGNLIDGTAYEGLDLTCPTIRLDGEIPKVTGPDVVTLTVPYVVLDPVSSEPITLDYFTTDTA